MQIEITKTPVRHFRRRHVRQNSNFDISAHQIDIIIYEAISQHATDN